MDETSYLWGGGSSSVMASYNAGTLNTASTTAAGMSGLQGFSGAMAVGGAISSAVGAYFSLQGQKSLLHAQADIDEINARIAEASARSALSAGQRQVQSIQLQTAQIGSAQKAAQAANGIDLGTGSAAEVRASSSVMGQFDEATAAANAVRAAWGYRTQETSYQNEAVFKRAGADAISPTIGAAASLLGGAGRVASNWYMMNRGVGLYNMPSNG
jgi:hypothetical protein